jgi:signal transduction histidine kinase
MAKVFTVDARTVLTLGRESIKDHTTALVELVKNSYDADANNVEVEIYVDVPQPYIRVADNGVGMTERQVENNWLRIGYSEKKNQRLTKLKRRKTGEKGIGRLSADRLGSLLELRTKAASKVYGLKIDWEHFSQEGKELGQILLDEIPHPNITIPRALKGQTPKTGTELIIRKLRQTWTVDDIENLYHELSMLISPFKRLKDFQIVLNTDAAEGYNGKVESDFQEKAYITLDAKFDGVVNVNYTVTIRSNNDSRKQKKKQFPLSQFIQKNIAQTSRRKKTDGESHDGTRLSCGPVNLMLLFFPQKSELFDLKQIRKFLNNNAGVRIYRDNVRVKPYGDPKEVEGDWLKLGAAFAANPAGARRASSNIRPKQLVGTVFIGRDTNPQLVDSSSREGLVHGDAFNDLRKLVSACVREVAIYHHEIYVEENPKITSNAVERVRDLSARLGEIRKGLRSIAPMLVRTAGETTEETIENIGTTIDAIKETVSSLSELENQSAVYRGLASIGIASAVFGHEIQSPISGISGFVNTAKDLLGTNPPQIAEAIEELENALEDAGKISGWGSFALLRVRRDKRRPIKVDLGKLTQDIIAELRPTLEALDIKLKLNAETLEGKILPMNFESVLINLITNASTACQQVRRQATGRVIDVAVKKKVEHGIKGVEIVVADSGGGVAQDKIDKVWEPLFTTKTGNNVGTGLGLTIVRDVVEEMRGIRKLDRDSNLKGARFTIWLPLQ